MASDTKEAWEQFQKDMKALGGQLHKQYRSAGDQAESADVNQSLEKLRQAAESVFNSLEAASRDPEVKAGTRQAARSFGAALAETFREVGAEIDKAIRKADLGLNPVSDGKVVRIPIPTLTEERRKEMVKHLHRVLEDHRTAVRNIRRDGNDAIKKALKDKKITEDEERRALDEIQKLTDEEIKKMEEMSKGKEKEVLELK